MIGIAYSSSNSDYPMASTVQMVQCSDSKSNQPITTLKSLKDPNFLLDNTSMRSQRWSCLAIHIQNSHIQISIYLL